jgi:dipeptidase
VSAVANSFVIRKIDPADDHFLYSENIFEVAERAGFWSKASGEKLDFLKTYAPMRSHPNYSTRRVWRIFSLAAPSLNLPAETNPWGDDYPFSVKAERPISPEDVMEMFRDHYEGKLRTYH